MEVAPPLMVKFETNKGTPVMALITGALGETQIALEDNLKQPFFSLNSNVEGKVVIVSAVCGGVVDRWVGN